MSFFSLIDKCLESVEAGNSAINTKIRFCNLNNKYFIDLSNSADEQLLAANDNKHSWADIAETINLELSKREQEFWIQAGEIPKNLKTSNQSSKQNCISSWH